ncbi:MAG: rhodanese-like domain-containing protein [Gemmatimonadota bacterium]|nr:rhodanese-like domain-containing protein [Gemmatimonadota bacterium]
MKQPSIIGQEALAHRLEAGPINEFWNVLTDDYFSGELIPKSRHVPLDMVGREAAALPMDTEIVVYCSGPDCPQSKAAGEKLVSFGFSNVSVFEGGLETWKASGREVETHDRVVA